ncbi:MAG: flavodoxin-dependent (E)-4-hydroxy-3-methylbut-2-enyl-diphosphate synthase [Coriobacteriales bacterium]
MPEAKGPAGKPAREHTRRVRVGGVSVGGGSPIAVQSMTSVAMRRTEEGPVLDAAGNLEQIARLADAGCEIVRVAVSNAASVEPFARVCARSPLPVVADIHFDHRLAVAAARAGAAALRINPGNIGSWDRVDEVIDAAASCGIPIRVGVNTGSLDERWKSREDLTVPERLCGSAVEFAEHFARRGFDDVVISAKASDVVCMMQTYRLISRALPQVPLHLGVTESGTLLPGAVKSAVGIGCLLEEGIGDTFRVSLTDDPVAEVEVAWEILASCGLRVHGPRLVSCPTCGRCQTDMIPVAREVERRLGGVKTPLTVAVMGCVVNGPGEAADADVGVACGRDSGVIFAQGRPLRRVGVERIVEELFAEIEKLES